MDPVQNSLKQLFQQEFAKMVAVLSNRYGLQHIEQAEDLVSETFLQAAETWGIKGIPENPAAWLYAVAKQKTLYHFRRNQILEKKVLPAIKNQQPSATEMEEADFSVQNIKDSQLQMIFAVCHPVIASEAQIGLALRILCGFGIDEIAEAFLTSKETINKRLFRAKEKLRTEEVALSMPAAQDLQGRLDNVLHVVYLLFNEGYYSRTQNQILQKDLCVEAIRLALMLTENPVTALPETYALLALMCFHASRFEARMAGGDALVLYEEQNESLWDQSLIDQGKYFLAQSASGTSISTYHIEARIAWWHCIREDSPEKWTDILSLYDQLLQISYSPSAALNRLYALYKLKGSKPALEAASHLNVPENHFYFLLLGELHKETDTNRSVEYFRQAHEFAKTSAEKQGIQLLIDALTEKKAGHR